MKRGWIVAGAAAIAFVVVLALAPRAALAGWRAAFVACGSVPVGAIMLLLIARVTGARWDAALLPLAAPAWLLLPAFVPVVVQQALFVTRPPHLMLWLAWPFFLSRGLVAIGLWWWLARALARDAVSTLGAGLALVAHGIVVTIVGTDWLLGASPAQPESAIGMVMATMQVLGGAGAVCLLGRIGIQPSPAFAEEGGDPSHGDGEVEGLLLGSGNEKTLNQPSPAKAGEGSRYDCRSVPGSGADGTRRDLSFLLIAAALGLAYLLYMDFLIVWYGNLPARVGWYVARTFLPWVALPPVALAVGLALPIACIALARTQAARRVAGGGALVALLLAASWMVGPVGGLVALPAAILGALILAPIGRRA